MQITIQITAADKARHAPLTAYTMVQVATRSLQIAFPEAQLFVSWADNHYGESTWTVINVTGGEATNATSIVREELEVNWACRASLENLRARRPLCATCGTNRVQFADETDCLHCRNVRKFERGLAI